MDLRDQLDRAIPEGPALPDPATRLATGRAALRRRRRATVGAGAAAVLLVAVGPFALRDSTSPDRDGAPAAPATGSADGWEPAVRAGAHVDTDTGRLVIEPEAVVLQRVDDLYPGKGTRSVALDVRYEGRRWWLAFEWSDRGGTSAVVPADSGAFDSFADFVADEISTGGISHGPPVGPEGG